MTVALTEKQFKDVLPAGLQKQVNPLLVMQVNNVLSSEEECQNYKENLITYASVLREGRFTLPQYLAAVKYVGYKQMNLTNVESHRRTFPEKHHKWMSEGITNKTISSYVAAYNKSKLVNLIYAQTLIPVHILNAPAFQQALNVQIEIMTDPDVSAKVRSDAANSVMTQVKPPEIKKFELDVGLKETDMLTELRETTMALARTQQAAIANSTYTAKEIAQSDIVEMEKVE